MHNRFLAVDVSYLLGRALWEQGHTGEVRLILEQALSDAEVTGCRRMTWPILFARGQMEPDGAQARRWFVRARETALSIAGHISNPEWHESFLNQAPIRAVI